MFWMHFIFSLSATCVSLLLCKTYYKERSIVGYSILRRVIRGGGMEIGLAMAPLFADNVHNIAKVLIKTAAEKCLAKNAVPIIYIQRFN